MQQKQEIQNGRGSERTERHLPCPECNGEGTKTDKWYNDYTEEEEEETYKCPLCSGDKLVTDEEYKIYTSLQEDDNDFESCF